MQSTCFANHRLQIPAPLAARAGFANCSSRGISCRLNKLFSLSGLNEVFEEIIVLLLLASE
jgi:hypothetical protein